MKNVEQYKDRFYNLMESTIGDVKPLISEQTAKLNFDCYDLYNAGFTEINKPYQGKQIGNILKIVSPKNVAYEISLTGIQALPKSETPVFLTLKTERWVGEDNLDMVKKYPGLSKLTTPESRKNFLSLSYNITSTANSTQPLVYSKIGRAHV